MTLLISMPGGSEWLLILLIIFIIGLSLLPLIFYLLTLQNTLNEIRVENRLMPPSNVWLTLIPIFGLVWQFIIVDKMADSLKNEFASRNMPLEEERPGYSIGLTYCILFCCSIIPILGILASIGGMVCWILYWVKINDYRLKIRKVNFS